MESRNTVWGSVYVRFTPVHVQLTAAALQRSASFQPMLISLVGILEAGEGFGSGFSQQIITGRAITPAIAEEIN